MIEIKLYPDIHNEVTINNLQDNQINNSIRTESNAQLPPVIKMKKWDIWKTILIILAMMGFIAGTLCLIIANASCTFEELIRSGYNFRINGYCCRILTCDLKKYPTLLVFMNVFPHTQESNCYFCNSSKYLDRLISGFGVTLALFAFIVAILTIVSYKKS